MPRPERLLTPRFVLVVTVGLCYFLAIGALLPTVPQLVTLRLGGDETAVGIAVGAFAVGAIVVRPWAGRIGDRFGRRVLTIAGPLLVGLSVASYHVVAGGLASLVAARLFGGLGEAALFVGAGTMITDLSPTHRRGEALSYWSVAIYGGLAFGPALGEAALGPGEDFGRVWTVTAGLCLAATALALATRETLEPAEPTGAAPPAGGRRRRTPLLHRNALLPGLVLFLVLVGLAGYIELLPLYAPELGLADSKGVFLVYGLVVLAVRVVGARIPDRVGPRRAASGAAVLSAAGLGIMAAVAHTGGLVAGTVVLALGMSLLFPAITTLALAGVPAGERGSVVGTVSTFFDASQGAGAPLLGALAALTSRQGAFAGGAVSCLAALVLLRAVVTRRAPAADPSVTEPATAPASATAPAARPGTGGNGLHAGRSGS